MNYDIIIIGGGLGGLECGYILSKEGFNVCILEQNPQLGGCLQSFKRNGVTFDTGLHYVGGMHPGESLHKLMQYFNLNHLPWHQLDTDGFDEVILQGKSYSFSNGFNHFYETLAAQFPNEKDNLKEYCNALQNVSAHQLDALTHLAEDNLRNQWLATSAYEFVRKTLSNSILTDVISGTSLKMDLQADTLPFYIFAQIHSAFILSAWRLKGGSNQIAESLATDIRRAGGTIRINAKVTDIKGDKRTIQSLIVNNNEEITANRIISDIHPSTLFDLISPNLLHQTYRSRINELRNSFGMFTAHLQLKKGKVAYRNRNYFIHLQNDLWNNNSVKTNNLKSLMVHFAVPTDNSNFATNIDILTPVYCDEMLPWQSLHRGKRGENYETWKQLKAERLVQIATQYFPEIAHNIEAIYTSSPITYRDYTGTHNGSAYGICKDYNRLMFTMLPTKTPIHNLFYTGQNVNFHGILGVSITAFLTCKELLGDAWLSRQFLKDE